jgi:hypothetical protein
VIQAAADITCERDLASEIQAEAFQPNVEAGGGGARSVLECARRSDGLGVDAAVAGRGGPP